MANRPQVRGLLLEECVLALLRGAGYRTVTTPGRDPTLTTGPAGLVVAGRGTGHQIDAIADSRFGHPFSNPQRLLVEAKFYGRNRPVSLPIVRGTVGVLKDVCEYWIPPRPHRPASKRYHYQAAIFSASPFTKEAQDYAFAQDIYLLPLRASAFFAPILTAIEVAVDGLPVDRRDQVVGVDLTSLRRRFRQWMQPDIEFVDVNNFRADDAWFEPVVAATRMIGRALIGTVGRAFPLMLTPRPGLDLNRLQAVTRVEIHFRRFDQMNGWTLNRIGEVEPLFTFDLPSELFELYASDGVLSPERAVELKAEYLNEIQAVFTDNDWVQVFTFRLDIEWLAEVRRNIRQRAGA